MTPGARVQAAIELLDEILQGTPAERALTNWARRSRFAGSKDRAAVRDHVFQALRCRDSYAHLGGAQTGRGIMIGACRADGADPVTVFTGEGHAPALVTSAEAERAAEPPALSAEFDLPDWIIPIFVRSLGGEAQARQIAEALKSRARVMVRVNLRKATVAQAITALAAEGIEAVASAIADTALEIRGNARALARSAPFRDGWIELQDGSSQAAMAMIDLPPGAQVLDYCAGGGGKTLALAARLDARWVAHDANPSRMSDLPTRAERAGITVRCVHDASTLDPVFDLVLCDVPCSGSGTWRRTPDSKWRFVPEDLDQLTGIQAEILENACDLVRPGGMLAYATCSVLEAENEARIAHFLQAHPRWQLERQRRFEVSDWGDGFFIALLRRS